MPFKTTVLAASIVLGLLSLSMTACKPSAPAVKTYVVKGVIKGFQSDRKVVILDHEAIPNLMEAMTMGWELKDAKLADGLKLNDKVLFTVEGDGNVYLVTALVKQP